MELEDIVDEFYAKKITSFEGIVEINDVKVTLKASLNFGQMRELLMVNQFAISRSNVAVNTTYVVDVEKDDKNKVISDFETLVNYAFFGVDKVAKVILPEEKKKTVGEYDLE